MANSLFRIFSSELIAVKRQHVRYGHKMRGKPPGIARTLQQRLDELNKVDPELAYKVDIGLPMVRESRRSVMSQRLAYMRKRRSDPSLERLARNNELRIDLEDVSKVWSENNGPKDILKIADHYGIYKDLYGDAYFAPTVPLDIKYNINDEEIAAVYRGNLLKPKDTIEIPTISYSADPDTLWTLLVTCPDGNLVEENNEYCHWFIGNIPGNAIEKGEQIIDYIRPFPLHGTGFHRYIFVLYKQDKKVDFTPYKKEQPCVNLRDRNWNTYNFYRDHQDYLTPAGLAFFQADWDSTVTDFFHNILDMAEPKFEYDFPKPYIKPQTWFPLRQPFNSYMDKYRDPKQINKEFLLKKLKKVNPFKEPEPPLAYPSAQYIDQNIPSWLKVEIRRERLGYGRINEIK